jgi:nucleoside-diphosphate kinase
LDRRYNMHNTEKTFAIIKPDAVAAGNTQNIINMIKANGFKILAEQPCDWTRAQAEEFYAVHSARPFFGELVEFMISGPIVMLVLEKENAVLAWRDLMGATNPKEAAVGTVRSLYGTSIGNNATHGSDSIANAKQEIGQFFPELV